MPLKDLIYHNIETYYIRLFKYVSLIIVMRTVKVKRIIAIILILCLYVFIYIIFGVQCNNLIFVYIVQWLPHMSI